MALARTKSSQTTYSCPFCEYKSKVKGSFESHLHQETGYKTFLCAFCSEDFIKEVELSDHFQKTHCNQKVSFTRRTMPEIEEWIKRLIDFQSSKSYVSLHRYPNKSSSESAVDRYFCSICKRYKRDIVTLKRHIFSHLQYRPYKCIHCSFQAVSASGVRVHTRDTHRKEENDFKVVSITRIDDFVEEIVNYQRPSHFTKTKEKSNEVRDVPASEKLGKKRKEIQVKSIRPSKNIVLKTVSQLGKSVDTLKVRIMKNKSNTDNNNKTCKKQVNKKLPIRKMKTSKKPSLKIKIKKNTQNLFEKEILPKLSTSEPYILEQHTNKKSTKEKLGINKTLKKYGVRKVTLRNYSRMPKNLKLNEHLITCIEEKCKSQLSAVKSAHHEDKKYICVEEEQVSLPQLKFQAPLLNTSSEQKLNNEVVESYCSEHVCDNKHLLPFEGNGRNFESHCIADHDYTMFPENKVMENKFSSQKFTAETNVEEENLQKRLEETGKMYEETFITEQLELMDDYVLLDKQSDLCGEQVNKVEKIERRGFNEKQNMSGEIIQVYIRKLKQKTDENHETKNDNEEWKKQLFEKEYSKASNLLKELNYKRSKLFLEKLNEENEKTKFQNNYEEAFHTSQLEKDYLKNVKGNEESCGMHTQFLCEESKEVRKLENELLAKSKSPKLLTKEHSFDTNHNLDLIGKINKSFGKKTGKTCDKDSSCCKEKTEEHQELMQQLNEPEDEKEGETYPLSEKDQEKEYQYEIIPEKNEEIIDSESKFENSQENVLQFNGKQWKGFKDEVKQKIDNRLKDAVKLHVEEAYMDNQETIKQAVRQQINNKEDITCQNEKGTFSQEPGKECRGESSICKNYLKFENRKQKEKEQQPGKKIKNSEETTKQADSHQIVENEGITFKHEPGKLHEENLENFIKVEDKKENMQIRMAQKTSWNKLRHSYKRDKGVNLMGESDKDINTSTHQDGTSKVKDLFLLNNENSLNNQNCESKEIDLNMIYLELQNEFKDKTEEYYYNTTQRQKVKKVQDDQLTIDGKKSDHHYQKLKKRKVVACQDRFKNKIKKLDCSIQEVPVNCHRKLKHNSEQIVMHGRRLENSGTPKIENRIRFWENDKKKNSAEVNDKSSDRVLYTNRSEVKYSKCKSRRKKTKNEKRIDSFEKLLCGPVHGAGSFTSNSEVKDSKLMKQKKSLVNL
ncbi:biorientation of chromosomes in cell division protein 1-like 1 [Limulus polyphemus]|uniref:Biorientation of chromosomes in cell division protein 1-like 1 n=1 Tax=Limulus polyphemus TaxID=6850 RepID=A0ABM1STT2_LIMPO|nr:biorientation of chromosomes in cell division protein 1-like 1 [Limulus polyphemus]XP_022247039.1 biorientation of chromosomes in cell division protein 1-like 1 [Limulus polyphemus]